MTGPITYEFAGTMMAVLGAAGWLWIYVARRMAELQREYRAELLALKAEQTALTLMVSSESAAVQHLKDAIDRLIFKVDQLSNMLTDVRVSTAGKTSRRTQPS